MAAHGIRDAADIDIFPNPEIFELCKNSEWEVHKWDHPERGEDVWLKKGIFELYGKFWYEGRYYSFEELLPYTQVINGFNIAPIYWLMNWKRVHARPKDLIDADLIESYLQTHPEFVVEPK